jgi:hypothetical protein
MRANIRQITIFISFRKNNIKICIAVINEQIPLAMKEQLANTKCGNTLLTANDIPTGWDIHRLLSYIMTQENIPDRSQSHFLPPHELQRPRATVGHPEAPTAGTGDLDANFAAFRLLGHEQADVTNIYLAAVRGGKHIEV